MRLTHWWIRYLLCISSSDPAVCCVFAAQILHLPLDGNLRDASGFGRDGLPVEPDNPPQFSMMDSAVNTSAVFTGQSGGCGAGWGGTGRGGPGRGGAGRGGAGTGVGPRAGRGQVQGWVQGQVYGIQGGGSG